MNTILILAGLISCIAAICLLTFMSFNEYKDIKRYKKYFTEVEDDFVIPTSDNDHCHGKTIYTVHGTFKANLETTLFNIKVLIAMIVFCIVCFIYLTNCLL